MTREHYQQALKITAKSMARVKSPLHLARIITRFIDREFGLSHTSIVIRDRVHSRYSFVDSKGDRKIPINLIRIDQDNDLVQWFESPGHTLPIRRDYLTTQQISELVDDHMLLDHYPGLEARLARIKDQLSLFRAEACVPGYYKGDLMGILVLGERKDKTPFSAEDLNFFQTLAHHISVTLKNSQFQEDLIQRNEQLEAKVREVNEFLEKDREQYYQIMLALAREVHAKDAYTAGHSEEVERLGCMTAEELGIDLSGRKKDVLVAALHLHDVGKIGIPDSILKKEGRLTEEEWLIMRDHASRGAKILAPIEAFKDVSRAVLLHHECFDGSGYPYGLKGSEIPIESRIICVVDTFHAIVSTRCYRKKSTYDRAISELRRCSGTQFDPDVVEAFIRGMSKRLEPRYCITTGKELSQLEAERVDTEAQG